MYNIYFHEWPLVLFTILAQITTGLTLALNVYHIKKGSINHSTIQKISLILAIMMAVSLILSCFHLANVFSGFYTLFRIFDNNLPREVFALGAFVGLQGLLYIMLKTNRATDKIITIILRLSLVFAVLGIIFMANIYGSMANTVISWNFGYAFALFFAVSLLLGGLTLCFMPLDDDKYKIGFKTSMLGLLLFLIVLPLYMIFLGKLEPINITNIFVMAPLYSNFLGIGLILTALGFGIMLFSADLSKANIKLIFILILVGQLLIRTLFYSLINTHLF